MVALHKYIHFFNTYMSDIKIHMYILLSRHLSTIRFSILYSYFLFPSSHPKICKKMWLFSSLQISKQLARLETNKSTKLATAITAHTSNSKEILCVVWNQVAWKLFRANFISEGLSKDIKILHKTHTHLHSMTKKIWKKVQFF